MAGPGMIAPILMHQLGLSACRRVATLGVLLGSGKRLGIIRFYPVLGEDQTSSKCMVNFKDWLGW